MLQFVALKKKSMFGIKLAKKLFPNKWNFLSIVFVALCRTETQLLSLSIYPNIHLTLDSRIDLPKSKSSNKPSISHPPSPMLRNI